MEFTMRPSLQPQSGPLPRPLRKIVLPGILFGTLLLAGCPDSPPGGNSGTGTGDSNGTPKRGRGPDYPTVLDEGLPNRPRTSEQTAFQEESLATYRITVDIGKKPILDAVAMLEETTAKRPQDPVLPHLRLRLFTRMRNDEFLDADLARARVRLGEAMLSPELASTPQLPPIIEMVVESYDHLGEADKGDVLLEKALKALSEPPAVPSPEESSLETPGHSKVIHLPTAPGAGEPAAPTAQPRPSRVPPSAPGMPGPAAGSPGRPSAAEQIAASPKPLSAAQQAAAAAAMRKRDWQSLQRFQMERLARSDYAAADRLLEERCRAAWEKAVADPDALPPVRDWVALCQTRARVARVARHPEVVEQVETELLATTRTLAEAHPDSAEHFALLVQMRGIEISRLVEKDPDGASRLLGEIRGALESSKFAKDPALALIAKSFSGHEYLIKEFRFRKDLIGKPAPPFDAERWVHGGPLALEALRGKVVLLEFWSPTRKASVAAFPRLNALHEEFHDNGLEIVGVTRMSGATWDPVRKRAEIVPHNPTVDTEVALLEAVTEHYQHQFPTFLVPQKTTFFDACGVKMGPHSLLLDRQGNIRLTQPTLDEADVRQLRETIESLLAE